MLTLEHIHWAYRLLLDREPENRSVLRDHLRHHRTTQALRREFMCSLEYRAHNQDLNFPRKAVIYETPLGFRMFLHLGDGAVSGMILDDNYEPHETAFIRRTCKPGQVAFDIGANLGYYTLLMATRVGTDGFVHAFEPREDWCAWLKRSLAENAFEGRCAVHPCALADFEGVSKFRVQAKADLDLSDPNYYSNCYLARHEPDEEKVFIPVKVETLDKMFPSSGGRRIDFIKIDAEGAEYLIFRGGENLLRRDTPIILSEVFDAQLRNVSGVDALTYVNFMASLRYQCHRLDEQGALYQITDTRRYFDSEVFRKRPVHNMVFIPA